MQGNEGADEGAWLFTYGTLRRGCANPMEKLLQTHARWEGAARFQGVLYLVDYYPGVAPSDCTDDVVHGDLYWLRAPEYVLDQLDAYEGCGNDPACEYDRIQAQVTRGDGGTVDAWLYVYRQPTQGLPRIEDGDYLRYLRT